MDNNLNLQESSQKSHNYKKPEMFYKTRDNTYDESNQQCWQDNFFSSLMYSFLLLGFFYIFHFNT